MVSLFNDKSEPLYLVRGEGRAQQIYNKVTSEWENLTKVMNDNTLQTASDRVAAQQAADTVSSHQSFNTVPSLPVLPDSVIDAVNAGMKGDNLRAIATDLGIQELDNVEIFPNNKAIADKITEVNSANKQKNSQR